MKCASGIVLVVSIHLFVRKDVGDARKNAVEANTFRQQALGNIGNSLSEFSIRECGGIAMKRGGSKVNSEWNSFLKKAEIREGAKIIGRKWVRSR